MVIVLDEPIERNRHGLHLGVAALVDPVSEPMPALLWQRCIESGEDGADLVDCVRDRFVRPAVQRSLSAPIASTTVAGFPGQRARADDPTAEPGVGGITDPHAENLHPRVDLHHEVTVTVITQLFDRVSLSAQVIRRWHAEVSAGRRAPQSATCAFHGAQGGWPPPAGDVVMVPGVPHPSIRRHSELRRCRNGQGSSQLHSIAQ